jgi:aminomuconate-semialdehyde/2-hydroxymuconate-6-semialdehyde dehydrogenase
VTAADAMVLGDPGQDGTQLGPLASETHYQKVTGYLDSIPADGGKLLTGGATGNGWFVRPTIAVDLPASARACREEIFGPVVTVTPFDGEDDGVKLANDTPYGLNAMLFTENLRRAHRVSAALQAGTVWVNCFYIRDLRAPFGGVGDSGWGREGGDYSREFCTEPKAVVMDI